MGHDIQFNRKIWLALLLTLQFGIGFLAGGAFHVEKLHACNARLTPPAPVIKYESCKKPKKPKFDYQWWMTDHSKGPNE